MEIKRTFDLLERLSVNFDPFAIKRDGKWIRFSRNQYVSGVEKFSIGLMKLSIDKGTKIITISNNRPEWNIVDMAIAQVGAIHIPLYPNIGSESLKYILKQTEAKMLIISSEKFYNHVKPVVKEFSNIEEIYSFDQIDVIDNWMDIINLGERSSNEDIEKLQNIKRSIDTNDICSIIYTSGTTGNPKGAMISHSNFISSVIATLGSIKPKANELILSILPLCHIYERIVNYYYQYTENTICYSESPKTLLSDINEVKPASFTAVPRVIEKVFDKIILTGKNLKGIKKMIFFWAVNIGLRYELNRANGRIYELKLKIANKLIFSKWREALGNNLRYIISGGAALQPRLVRIFAASGIIIQEGYGLTETAVISVNGFSYPDLHFNTVGKVLKNSKIKIAKDGEILIKGGSVMQSYFKDEEATKLAIDSQGWFHSGDIGILDKNDVLKVVDRKKSMFKLSTGKYIAPQIIENKIKESPFIEQVIVIGESKKFASALLCPAFEYLHSWSVLHNIRYRDNKELINNKIVIERIQREINFFNQKLEHHEKVKKFKLIKEEWSTKTGELTPTLKLRRNFIIKKHKKEIESMYDKNYI